MNAAVQIIVMSFVFTSVAAGIGTLLGMFLN